MRQKEVLQEGIRRLKEAGIEEAELDAWLLFSYNKDVNRTWYYLHMEDEADGEERERFYSLIDQRCTRMPVQYIIGVQEFMGLPFRVNPAVLIPRQDTEVLVEECLKRLQPGERVLDMCTGSGCILVSLLHYGKDIRGTGADISEGALATAAGNAEYNGAKAKFIQSDLFERVEGTYDMIVSNPPYISEAELLELMPEVGQHEPRLALDGKEDGLYFYREIVREAGAHLRDGGWLCFEIGCSQGADVRAMMEQKGYEEVQVIRDLPGLDRVVVGKYRRDTNV